MRKAAAMDTVLAGRSHSQWKVRRTCADFLDHWGDARCVDPLLRALNDSHENVRRLALHALLCQDCKACPLSGDFIPALAERASRDRSLRVRRIATQALGSFLRDPRALNTLRHILAHDRDSVLLSRARRALEQHDVCRHGEPSP